MDVTSNLVVTVSAVLSLWRPQQPISYFRKVGRDFLHVLYISIAYVLHQFREVFAILQSNARSLFSK
jgi:hypothetical protein